MNENNDECKGCHVKCKYYKAYVRDLVTKAAIIKCPCTICIIKMVCTKGCEEFDKFYDKGISRYLQSITYKGYI